MKNRMLLLILGLSIISVAVLNISYIRLLIHPDHYQRPSEESLKHYKAVHEKIDGWDSYKKNIKKPITTSISAGDVATNGGEEDHHQVAGLSCAKYGGPSDEIAAEMVYWRDIPSDAQYESPFKHYGPEPKYITFEPDEGGWNNIRMSMETAVATAFALGRTLVLPPEQNMYLLDKDHRKGNNRFTFKDFFHFDSIAVEHEAVEVISMEEFLRREALTGNLRNKATGEVTFPPGNITQWDGHLRKSRGFYTWLRNSTASPIWSFSECVVGIPEKPGKEAAAETYALHQKMKPQGTQRYIDNPTPVDAPPLDRLNEMLAGRQKLCMYGDIMQHEKVIHFMGDNASGARLLVHFYAFLFFQDYRQDLFVKRFVRDHLRYIDEIQCTAARVVHAMREKAREHGDPDGNFDTFHIRRGDFQYKQTRIDADQIYENIKDVLKENTTVFIATDEKQKNFFKPLESHYHVYYLQDFKHLYEGINTNFFGMLDQRIASRGRIFIGAYFSTFTGYINRMRGHHSQKEKLPGYEKGEINSYYYVEKKHKLVLRKYYPLHGPLWSREFPVAWRDIDHGLEESHYVSR